jgi:hypothetical protein
LLAGALLGLAAAAAGSWRRSGDGGASSIGFTAQSDAGLQMTVPADITTDFEVTLLTHVDPGTQQTDGCEDFNTGELQDAR